MFKDAFNGRWRMIWRKPYAFLPSVSRSWLSRGERESYIEALLQACQALMEVTGVPCEIEGLLPADAGT